MRIARPFLVVLLALCCPALFAQSTVTPRAYSQALGFVVGQIRTAKAYGEICTAEFSDLLSPSQEAYSKWREQYAVFVNEMEERFARHQDIFDSAGARRENTEVNDKLMNAVKAKLQSKGQEQFREACEIYPAALAGPTFDIERSQAEAVRAIRLVPR